MEGRERRVGYGLRRATLELSSPPRLLAQAEAGLVAQCMARAGLRYIPWETWAQRTFGPPMRLGGLGAPLPLETARENGYAELIDRVPEEDDPDTTLAQYLASLSDGGLDNYFRHLDPESSPEARITLHSGARVGAATTGCVAEARRHMYGSVARFLEIHNFQNELMGRRTEVDADLRVERASATYRLLMRDAGHVVADTADARRQANERFGNTRRLSDPVSEDELGLALVDAGCQQSSGINEATEEALIDVVSAWLIDNDPRIRALHDAMGEAVARARAVLVRIPSRYGR